MMKKYFFLFLSFILLFFNFSFCLSKNIAADNQNIQAPDDFINRSVKLIISLARKFLSIFRIAFEKIKIIWQKFLRTKIGEFLQPLVANFKKEFPEKLNQLRKEIIILLKGLFFRIENIFTKPKPL